MPHTAGHREGEPILDFTGAFEEFAEQEPQLDFTGAFGVGQGRTQQKFVPDNNSIVNMPATSSASFNARESKELIEGRKGFFGNTSVADVFNTPGGFLEPADILKLPGGVLRDISEVATVLPRERAVLGAERLPVTRENIQETLENVGELAFAASINFAMQDFKTGAINLLSAIGRARKQALPPVTPVGIFNRVVDFAIQKNPEVGLRFEDKMLELQESNEDFLIRNGLIFGPDDEPTLVGNFLSQLGTSGGAILLSVLTRSPLPAAVIFGSVQQASGFQEAEEAGKDPFEATTLGNIQAGIEISLMSMELGVLNKELLSKSASITRKAIAGLVAEGVEESTTEALILGVQNATGVKETTAEEATLIVFQAGFYGALAGFGTTGTVATVQRIAGGNISQGQAEKVANVINDVSADITVEVAEQLIDDANTELEIAQDGAAEQTVTKAAKTTAKQQERVVEILTAMNEGQEFDVRRALDEINPEVKVQRQKQILERSRRARVQAVTKQAIKEEVVRLQAEIQIAEQQGNEEEAARLSERISEIQQAAFADENIFEAVEELEAEGVFVRGNEQLERAVAEIDDVLRPLRAGVRVGRALQKAETRALQDSLTAIVDRLGDVVDPKTQARLQRKVRTVNSIATAESVRRDIVSLARKSAFRKFISQRRVAIDKLIKDNTKPKKAKLAPGYQNSLDRLNKMRKGIEKARGDDTAVVEFTGKQSDRIASQMDHGIPPEGLMLQVRYLDILNERAKVVPQTLAKFEDDLNAFIASGKGEATVAEAAQQNRIDETKAQVLANEVRTSPEDLRNRNLLPGNAVFNYFAATYDTAIVALGAEGTVFDFFGNDVRYKTALNDDGAEIVALADGVSEGNGTAYLRDIGQSFFKENVIDLPREGLTKVLGGNQSKDIKWTRGELIYAWMILEEPSIRDQIMNPKGKMAWTQDFVDMIRIRMTDQDKQFARGLFEFYDRSYERFNEVYRRLNNRDLPKVEFYSHLRRPGEENLPASVHNETTFTDLMVGIEKDPSTIITAEPAEAKKRQLNAAAEIKIDNVLNSLTRYNYDVEHYIAYAEDLYLARKIINDDKFRTHVQEILGEAGYETFFSHLKVYSRQNISAKKYLGWLEKFRQFQFKSTLLFNPKIGIGQLASISAWSADMPKTSFGSGVASYSANPDTANDILNQHPTFKNRELNFDPDIDQLGPVTNLFHLFALPIRKGDAFAVRSGAWARYKWLVDEQGVAPDEALNQVARFAERSQQSVLASQRTLAQKSEDPLIRTLTMYRSSLTAMLNVSMQSIIEYRRADISTPQKKAEARGKLIETLAIQNVVIPASFAFMTGGNIPRTVLAGSLVGVAGLGELVEFIAGVVVNIFAEEDDRIYIGGVLDLPAEQAFEEVLREIAAIEKFGENLLDGGFDKAIEESDIGAVMEGIVNITDVVTPVPITNILNAVEGIPEAMGLADEDPIAGVFKALGYKTQARERMLKRIDAVTGGEPEPISGRVLTQGVF